MGEFVAVGVERTEATTMIVDVDPIINTLDRQYNTEYIQVCRDGLHYLLT